MTGRHAPGGRRTPWVLLAVVLALVGAASLVLALQGRRDQQAPPVAAPAAGRSPAQATPADPVTPAPATTQPPAPPVRLLVPTLHVSTRLLRLGVHRDGTVEVPAPEDADRAGWFRLGPPPGQVGSAVILGHVDSLSGPAVFYELRLLVPGDRVDVRLADRAVARFRVDRVRTYPNADFPARRVYGSHGYAGLNLVTCGGAYDRETGYQANVVVYTRLVHTTPAPA
ncbi:class F sortase [Nocardioides panacis]|uniref:Class F sortase n=1 Tax=Nocardioides panacis TaxID=2849501 RepID=A0A975SYM9_9ACTN|nr:class F sortase [Nocardioides panacis]QWZ07830.1 class F sortase [Nocardioides panacis]